LVMSFEISQFSQDHENQRRKDSFYLKVSNAVKTVTLRVDDICQFIQHSLYGPIVTVRPLFASVSYWQDLRHYVLILLHAHGRKTFFQYKWSILEKSKFYVCSADFLNPYQFWKKILRMPYKMYGPTTPPFGDPGLKVPLVLTMEEMVALDFTVPTSMINEKSLKFSLPFYTALSERSPAFAIDCEMVMVGPEQRALTRVSIINENYEVLLDVLVKPEKQIIDYLTTWSGMTPELLDGVTLRLADVQHYLQEILPPNAILVGHSIHFDMNALELYHPYVIDIGFTLNLNENSARRTSLRRLCDRLLGLNVQQGSEGHCSIEDAYATMRLFHLKLNEGGLFGCVPLGWKRGEVMQNLIRVEAKKENVEESAEVKCMICNKWIKMICTDANCRCRKLKKIFKCQKCMCNNNRCKEQLLPQLEAIPLDERIATVDSFKFAMQKVLKGREKSFAAFQEAENEKWKQQLSKSKNLGIFRHRTALYLQSKKQDCMLCSSIDPKSRRVEHYHVTNDKTRMDYLMSQQFDHAFRVNECEINSLKEQQNIDQNMCDVIDTFPPQTLFSICFIKGEQSQFVFALTGQN
ncbi:putative RNA exonuclease NEF-sp, partial [Trichinella pseudospiralis]